MNPVICVIFVFPSSLHLEALSCCLLITSFKSLSITPLVCNAASKFKENIHRRTPETEPLFYNVAAHTFPTERPRVTASGTNALAQI